MTRTASPSCECPACKGGGLLYPPARVRASSISAAVRALPVPCTFCPAGLLEREVGARVADMPKAPEIEIYKFRKAKG